jgi:hypothetical protein
MKLIKPLFILFLVVGTSLSLRAEPFITTDKLWLRADIETLANLGVIKTPITTWPLTWGPILKDLSNAKLTEVPEEYHGAYFRVLRTGRKETGKDNSLTELRLSFNQETQLLRRFGDKFREKREFSTRVSGMSSHFAWNIEVTALPEVPKGNRRDRYDGSYLAGIAGNWIVYLGEVEKWWGPGFENSLILSNNAKPIPAINLKRNYAEPFEHPLFNWLGPWTLSAFAGQLDDPRTVDQAKLLGMSVAFNPIDTLEIGLRRTAQWGGEGRPETLGSLADMFLGLDNCDEGGLSCDDPSTEPGNQLAAIDISWRNNFLIPTKFYLQMVGEDEAGYFPSKKSFLFGVTSNLSLFGESVLINLETLETTVDGDGNVPGVPFDGYNTLYEHSIYTSGYRYYGRSLGATIDNDSKITAVSAVYQTLDYGNFSLAFRSVELNFDSTNVGEPGGHSLVNDATKFSDYSVKWNYLTANFGEFELSLIKRSKTLQTRLGEFDGTSLGFSWKYMF